jgi:hypothetical protein
VKILSDACDAPVLAGDWVVDRLVARQAAIAADQQAFARHALVELLLLFHRDIESQGFDPALRKLQLHIAQLVERVLRDALDRRFVRWRRWWDLWVLPHILRTSQSCP